VDGLTYDIYSPITNNADRIVSEVARKGNQAHGVILDLSRSSVTAEQLGNVLNRAQGTGSRIQDVIILWPQ
jgi:filamentous hemagglutinin